MTPRRVLVTGATGCVGHYVVEALLARGDCELVLVARHPDKLQLPGVGGPDDPRVSWIVDDVRALAAYRGQLTGLAAVVHIATAWGDPEAYAINVDATLALAEYSAPAPLLYFSTASILGPDNRPLEAALSAGHDYIRSKYLAYQAVRASQHAGRTTVLFPTIVFGGGAHHPTSHATLGLPLLQRLLWLLRHVRFDGSLHFIHAADIARIISHLLDAPRPGADLVLGNANVTVNALVEQLRVFHGIRASWGIDLTPLSGLIERLAGSRMTPWDRLCLRQRHFRYDVVNPASLGLAPGLESLDAILAAYNPRGVPHGAAMRALAGG